MYEIKKIHIWPFARSFAIVFTAAAIVVPVALAIVFGFVEAFIWGYGSFDFEEIFEILFDDEFWIFYLIIVLVTAVISLVVGTIGAFAYNLISGKIGGIKMDIAYFGKQQNSQENKDSSAEQNGG